MADSERLCVIRDGRAIVVTPGAAYLHVSGHALDRTWWPADDAILHRDIKDWGRRRDCWGSVCLPYEMTAMSVAQVAAIVAAQKAA